MNQSSRTILWEHHSEHVKYAVSCIEHWEETSIFYLWVHVLQEDEVWSLFHGKYGKSHVSVLHAWHTRFSVQHLGLVEALLSKILAVNTSHIPPLAVSSGTEEVCKIASLPPFPPPHRQPCIHPHKPASTTAEAKGRWSVHYLTLKFTETTTCRYEFSPLSHLQWFKQKSGRSTMTARSDLQYLVRAASQHVHLLCPEQDPLRCSWYIKRGCNTSSLAGMEHNTEQVKAGFWGLNACRDPLTRWNLFHKCLQEFPELMGSQCHYKHTGQTHKPSWWFFISSQLSCTSIYYGLLFPSSGGARSGHLNHRDHPPTDIVPWEQNWDKPT